MKSLDNNSKYTANMSNSGRCAADDIGLDYKHIDDVLFMNPFIYFL